MIKALLAVDGSESCQRATRKLVDALACLKAAPDVVIVAVALRVPNFPSMHVVVSDAMIEAYYEDEWRRMLAPSTAILDAAGVGYSVDKRVGRIAESIVDAAHRSQRDVIFMGTRGMTALSNMVLGSVATRVLHLADVPVLLVH